MTTIRGNSGAYLTLQPDSGPAVEFSADLKAARITNEDKDDVTFAEVKNGEVTDATLALTAITGTALGRLWRFLWENAGAEVEAVFGPHGNEDPSATEPHFAGTVKIPRKPEVGNEATVESSRPEFEYEAPFIGAVTLDTGV